MGAIPLTVFALLAIGGLPIALVMVITGLAGAVTVGGLDFLEIIADRLARRSPIPWPSARPSYPP